MKKNLFTKTLLASAITFSAGTMMAAPYDIIDLGKVEGGTNSFAYGINAAGEVVGYGDGPIVLDDDGNQVRSFNSHALLFSNNQVIDLGTLPSGDISIALAINDNGQIIGRSNFKETVISDNGTEVINTETYLSLFESGVVTNYLIENMTDTQGLSINNNGFVVGSGLIDIDTEDGLPAINRGFIFDINNDSLISLISPITDNSSTVSFALSINNSGDVVGFSQKENGDRFDLISYKLSIDNPTEIEELPTLGQPITTARDINNNGLVVGNAAYDATSNRVAFYYDSNSDTELTRIPFFADNFDSSTANAVNDNGQIVGQALVSSPSTGINAAFIFENNELKNLNNLIACNSGWILDNATNINNNGEIIGYGLRTEVVDGETINEVRAFKLMPTGGSIETCTDPDDGDDSNSSGGSWNILGIFLLSIFGLRRKVV